MLELLGQSEGECKGVCVGVCLGVHVEGLGRSEARLWGFALGEEGNRLRGRGIPVEERARGAGFTLTPPLILDEKEEDT